METETIFGHNQARKLLDTQVESGALSHAYLFYGPAGIGKGMVAKNFATKLLHGAAADLFQLDIAEQNSIEELRSFLSIISARPVAGQWKVALIDNFDFASPILANALLKTLEEPSQSTVIILLSSRPLLPTIMSRCQLVSFNRLSPKEMAEFVKANGLNFESELLTLAGGSPGRLLRLMNEAGDALAISAWARRLDEALGLSTTEKLLLVSELGGEEASTLREVLLALLERKRANLASEPQTVAVMRRLVEALDLMRFNINKKLVLQRLLL